MGHFADAHLFQGGMNGKTLIVSKYCSRNLLDIECAKLKCLSRAVLLCFISRCFEHKTSAT